MDVVSKGQKHYTDRLKMILISATRGVLRPGQISLMDFPPARCLCVTYRDNSWVKSCQLESAYSCRSSSDPHSSAWALIATDLTVTEPGSAPNSFRIKKLQAHWLNIIRTFHSYFTEFPIIRLQGATLAEETAPWQRNIPQSCGKNKGKELNFRKSRAACCQGDVNQHSQLKLMEHPLVLFLAPEITLNAPDGTYRR